MNNYRFTISYDGSRYSGWEHQKHTDDTIQGKIEAVLAKMCDTDTVKLVGAGRTDAGVHLSLIHILSYRYSSSAPLFIRKTALTGCLLLRSYFAHEMALLSSAMFRTIALE